MDDSGFRKILNPLLEGMQANFNINADNIREKIGVNANDVHYHIKLEVCGVNFQFISDGKVQLRILAIKELEKNHTGFYSKTVLDKSH